MADQTQLMKAFWDWTPERSNPHLPQAPTDEEIQRTLSADNSDLPLNEVVVSAANEGNFRILRRFAFTAFKRYNHSCQGCNFGIYSPPGQGKTFIVKRWAETIGLPFVFIQSSGLPDTWELFQQISKECEAQGTPVVPMKQKRSDFTLPPCIVFFDEAHELKDVLQRGALLNPLEPDDGFMHIREPGKNGDMFVVNCKNVCWIVATTNPADLFDAFRSRFTTSIEWVPATPQELPTIIRSGLQKKLKRKEISFAPDLDQCQLISKYQTVPRLAIHSFGVMAVQQKDMSPASTWEEACRVVAEDLGIDEWGLSQRQVTILSALGQRPIAIARLADIGKCRIEQVKKMELPALMQYTNAKPFVVSISGRGVCITEAGQAELDKRKIPHKGRKVTAEYFESKR